MSEEEKQAIETLEDLKVYNLNKFISDKEAKAIVTVIKLINKQQKEIERLKSKKYILNAETNEIKEIPISENYISKDKIKEKIDEITKEYFELFEEKRSLDFMNINGHRYNAMKLVLEELLGE